MYEKTEASPELQVLTTKDVEAITGLLERQARRLIRRVRKYFQKPPWAKIVVTEFCHVTGYKIEAVYNFLNLD
ncbi:hypothetical protein [Paraflavitalea speifideaquila]|uniref:hypothetical protein n=1 Tax=Paraflavitalea speifideaquila TaxID=3076558 RepID=UPI0028E1A9E4|nr:hypothetical protein [Paraflavitalea speifideiaquila]